MAIESRPASRFQPSGPPGSGQVAKPRSIGVCILLAIVTLGIYAICWVWMTHADLKRRSGMGIGGPLGCLIFVIVSPVTYFLLPHEVRQTLEGDGRPSRVSAMTGFWFLLPLIGHIVWFVKVQGQLNDYWRSLGAIGLS